MGVTVMLLIFGMFMVVGLIFFIINIYNSLLVVKENVNKSWANIDVILKQRYDEIPQLIKICEQYVQLEQGMVTKIMNAREKMVLGKSIKEKADGSAAVTSALGGMLAVGESNPELKANANFMQIQTRLSDLEETLADRRELYNDSVNILNTRIQQIPDVFFAGMLGIERRQMFEVGEAERGLPDLNIKFKR
jgi:LemA protein